MKKITFKILVEDKNQLSKEEMKGYLIDENTAVTKIRKIFPFLGYRNVFTIHDLKTGRKIQEYFSLLSNRYQTFKSIFEFYNEEVKNVVERKRGEENYKKLVAQFNEIQ